MKKDSGSTCYMYYMYQSSSKKDEVALSLLL